MATPRCSFRLRERLIDLEVARALLSLDGADWDDRDILPGPKQEKSLRRV